MKTLIIVDVQNDFLPGGSLEVPNSGHIVSVINRLQPFFDLVVATQDWHPSNHVSFIDLWPPHCIQGSSGADFPKELSTKKVEAIFRKGTDPKIDSYSGFYDNHHKKSTGLAGYLREKGARDLYFCGLAADICVTSTIKDAIEEGFHCHLILDATQPLDVMKFEEIKKKLKSAGVNLLTQSFFGPN